MTHSLKWLLEFATTDMMALIGTAMLKGAIGKELDYIETCIENYIMSDGTDFNKSMELLYSKYPVDHMPEVAKLYAIMTINKAPEKELEAVNDYYYGFRNCLLGVDSKKGIQKLKNKYMNLEA